MIAGVLKKTELTEAQYRNLENWSSSDLRLFLTDRKAFYKTKILGEAKKELTSKSVLYGSAVHAKLLEPHNFDNLYKLSNLKSTPGGNMITFVESLVENRLLYTNEEGELTVEFSQIVESAYEASGYAIAVAAVLNKFTAKHKVTGESPEDYFKEVLEAKFNGVTIITVQDMAIIDKICEIVKNDEFVGHIYQENDDWNELKIEEFEIDGVKLKGMIDKVVTNDKDRILQIYDLKCLYDNQSFKRDYYLKRLGYIPAYLYWEALRQYVKDGGLGEKYKSWSVPAPIFTVVDTTCFYAPINYLLSAEDLYKAYEGFTEGYRNYKGVKEILEEIKYAQEHNMWTRTMECNINEGRVAL